MLITELTPFQALCWVLHTNNPSCATNHPLKEVTTGMPFLQKRKLRFGGGGLTKGIQLLKGGVRM